MPVSIFLIKEITTLNQLYIIKLCIINKFMKVLIGIPLYCYIVFI